MPPIPPARSRIEPRFPALVLHDETIAAIVERLLAPLADAIYNRFEGNMADLVDTATSVVNEDYLACPICSHDGCVHYHARTPYDRKGAERYIPAKTSTIYTWIHLGRMPRPISGPPYEWHPCVLACYKIDRVVLPGYYDRDLHLALLETALQEQSAKREAKSRKLSAHMRRENARRRQTRKRVGGRATPDRAGASSTKRKPRGRRLQRDARTRGGK
ncbi:MAG: hypothetical protein WA208_19245 [Thermoanaerobaculia bacterium]